MTTNLKRAIICTSVVFLIIFLYSLTFLRNKESKKVIANKVQVTHKARPTSTPTPTIRTTTKSSYTIAVFGDSMVDTMGENMEYLSSALKSMYPLTQFKLYNYGIGSQNVEQGIARFNQSFSYQTRNYPAITSVQADVIILGSFSYNPFFPYDKLRHYTGLINLIEEAKKTGAQVYVLVEIAPLYENFGKGPHGPNMLPDAAKEQAQRIVEQLEDSIVAANTQGVSVINVFSPTEVNGKFGNNYYTNSDDGIHPSVYGHEYTASKIASTIVLK